MTDDGAGDEGLLRAIRITSLPGCRHPPGTTTNERSSGSSNFSYTCRPSPGKATASIGGHEAVQLLEPVLDQDNVIARALLDRPDRLAGGTVEHVEEALLRQLHGGANLPSVDGEVAEDG